jgi:hypothetical protein
MRAGRRATAAAVSLVLLCGAVGCAGNSSSAGSTGSGGGAGGGVAKRAAALPGEASNTPAVGLDSVIGDARVVTQHEANADALPPVRSTVIKTAQLSLAVKKSGFADALDQANQIATDEGGYVISTDQSGGRQRSALIVIRVPAARFTEALGKMHHLGGGKLRSESVNGEEVGQAFVDLAARERNLHAQERVLLRLMNRAISVSDTIRVEGELSQVQGQIEQIAGRLRYLHDQADMSTITVSLKQSGVAAAPPGKPGSLHSAFSRAWHGTVSVISGVIVGAGVVLPIAILLAIAAAIGTRVWPTIRRRIEPRAAAPAGE